MTTVHHRFCLTIDGHPARAGRPARRTPSCCCTSFPANSFLFRDLIPALADRYHVIAPDHTWASRAVNDAP